jgi:peroxiredoxin
MTKTLQRMALSLLLSFQFLYSWAQPLAEPPDTLPDMEATDMNGKEHRFAAYKGRVIVLEWYNPECPFVRKHYDSQNMQKLQKTYTAKRVVWFTINSSAAGKSGHQTAAQAKAVYKKKGMASSALILDSEGKIGKALGAKRTPHMMVIDGNGKIVYHGAIDNKPTFNAASIQGATNHVKKVLDAVVEGKPAPVKSNRPYGTSIRY